MARIPIGAFWAVTLAAVLAMAPARATHLPDHRYWVWGEVTYADGKPAGEVDVKVTGKDGADLGGVRTNRHGRYRMVFHLHNPDLGKIFDMRVGNVSRKVRVVFDPNDRKAERGRREDFVIER